MILVGLITKHGILIVEVAHQLRLTGLDRREAVLEAATLRLRPILMTTLVYPAGPPSSPQRREAAERAEQSRHRLQATAELNAGQFAANRTLQPAPDPQRPPFHVLGV